ncbi:MAG: Hsp20/alpha crystallin family protein [Planctomycetota bacterium]|nr:Hsp20/alpha crystallin family protein [Planctomycetota bacterium]
MWTNRFHNPGLLFGNNLGEFKEIFDELTSAVGTAPRQPILDVWQKDDEAIVRAELPGLKVEDIKLTVLRDELTLEGHKAPETLGEGSKYIQRERLTGDFKRTIKLPFEIENGAIEAKFTDGILEVKLPRSAAEKARKIDIKLG